MTALPEKDPVTGKYPEPAEGEPVVHAHAGAPKADGCLLYTSPSPRDS